MDIESKLNTIRNFDEVINEFFPHLIEFGKNHYCIDYYQENIESAGAKLTQMNF